jgi:hypothetical protein
VRLCAGVALPQRRQIESGVTGATGLALTTGLVSSWGLGGGTCACVTLGCDSAQFTAKKRQALLLVTLGLDPSVYALCVYVPVWRSDRDARSSLA